MKNKTIPNHLAVIMDGNGRWAKERGLSRSEGHIEGAKALEKLVTNVFESGIKVLSIFAFSTENFKRSEEEVNNLMNLFVVKLRASKNKYIKNNIRVVFSGRREGLSKKVIDVIEEVESDTKENDAVTFNICWNYGGQYEILDMVKKISDKVKNGEIEVDDINLKVLEKNLYQELPPVDFMIRTSGELRTSGFMLYSSAYTEYYFTDTYFPDFDKDELDKALKEYSNRNRRFGNAK